MQNKQVKWYNLFWVRLIGVLIIVLGIYIAARKTVTYYNLNEYLKTEIEGLKKQNKSLDSLYQIEKEKKEKIRVVKERIQVAWDLERIRQLEKEIEELRKQIPQQVEPLSPEDLDIYFRQLLKK